MQVFYTTTARASEVKGHWCHACYSEARDGLTQMDGSTVRKTDLNKRKNDEEVGATCCLVQADLCGCNRLAVPEQPASAAPCSCWHTHVTWLCARGWLLHQSSLPGQPCRQFISFAECRNSK